jgi:hypothetical protein
MVHSDYEYEGIEFFTAEQYAGVAEGT